LKFTSPANLSDHHLINLLALNPRSESGWKEFYCRFHKVICLAILRESNQRAFEEGRSYPEDYAQEVYRVLIKDNCRALKEFKGLHAHSFNKYLIMISARVVLNSQKLSLAAKRIPPDKKKPLEAFVDQLNRSDSIYVGKALTFDDGEAAAKCIELLEEIDLCLNKVFSGSKNKQAYKKILKLHLCEALDANDIAERLCRKFSRKRISNIICQVKQQLQAHLEKTFIQ